MSRRAVGILFSTIGGLAVGIYYALISSPEKTLICLFGTTFVSFALGALATSHFDKTPKPFAENKDMVKAGLIAGVLAGWIIGGFFCGWLGHFIDGSYSLA